MHLGFVQFIDSKDDDLSAIGLIIENLWEALHDPCLINVNWVPSVTGYLNSYKSTCRAPLAIVRDLNYKWFASSA